MENEIQKEKTPMSESEKRIRFLENKIREIPLSEVLMNHGVQLVKRSGQEILGYCPFHPDSRPGSFSVNDNKGVCQCFSCGKGGNAVKFMEITEGLSHNQAVAQLACDENLISDVEFQILTNSDYQDKKVKNVKKRIEKKKPEKTSAYIKMANDVYSLFPMIFGLSDEDYYYLKNERQLKDERIQTYFPIGDYSSNTVIKKILRVYPEYLETLKNLAGFFEDERGRISMSIPEGIGIPIRNSNGKVVAIQIRKRKIQEGEQRYTWMTSSFAKYNKSCKGGASPGAPIDVLTSEFASPYKIAIVEGRFKSEILAMMGFTSLSVQGVGNYAGIEKEIQHFSETKVAYIFYDADMLQNTAVLNQAIKLGQYLNEKCPQLTVKYCIWHEELGKGIDDLILKGNKKDLKCISQETMTSVFNETIGPLMKKYGFTDTKCRLTKEQRDTFNHELKTILTKKLF